jgi:hypothetical protein
LTEIVRPLAAILMPLPPRSGKFGTPWLRMHLENASEALTAAERSGDELDAVARPAALDGLVPVGELEPQAATSNTATSAAIAQRSRAGDVRRRFIWCVSVVPHMTLRSAACRTGRYSPVSCLRRLQARRRGGAHGHSL